VQLKAITLLMLTSTLAAISVPHTGLGESPDKVYRNLPIAIDIDFGSDNVAPANLIKIPRRPGPEADQTLVQFGANVEEIDKQILKGKRGGSLAGSRLAALIDARNATMSEILDGQRILTNTSGGVFPTANKVDVDKNLDAIKRALTSPPRGENVKTKIEFVSSLTATTVLVYQTYADSISKSSAWSTYTPDQRLAIATYIFQVRVANSRSTCEETVPVLNDPTERHICGGFTP
jgi:hypothetical protein